MLTKEIKNKINRCRDLLVGQLPLPSDQVELITITLIYKFMDDIDEQSRKLGGKVSFFINGLSEYSWQNLMSNQLSGDERVSKFIQAIEAITRAQNIPELFKSIFRNTFLKFRDARTLKLFLDEINTFEYEHSEELGNAFEYLLNSMGTQGQNGQFRTPRNIIDFIVEVVDPDKDNKILDPACGTAGFLISAYKHILRKYTTGYEDYRISLNNYEIEGIDIHWGDKLRQIDKDKISKRIEGYDITPLMVRLSQVNMYLHHFPNPLIHDYDTLSNKNRWNDKYDCILANPPFMTPKGGVEPHDQFRIRANKAEVLFSDYIIEHLTPNGKAGWIVPEGIIFQGSNDYVELRRWLINEMGLWAVVSLPAQIFQPYSGVKTSILFVDRAISRTTENILLVKVENDGFSLNTNRTPIKENDLPAALNLLTSYKKNLDGFREGDLSLDQLGIKTKLLNRNEIAKLDAYESISETVNFIKKNYKIFQNTNEKQREKTKHEFLNKIGLSQLPRDEEQIKALVEKEIQDKVIRYGEDRLNYLGLSSELQKHLDTIRDYNLGFEKYFNDKKQSRSFELITVGDICELGRGRVISKEYIENNKGIYPVYSSQTTDMGIFGYINSYDFEGEYVTWTTDGANAGKAFYRNGKFNCTNVCGTIKANSEKIDMKYLASILNEVTDAYVIKVGNPKLMNNVMASIKIPLPHLDIQQEIVAEIESYQKILDGARQVVENYKPLIKIDLSWPQVELETLCDIVRGSSPRPQGDPIYYGGNVPRLMVADITRDGMYTTPSIDFLTEEGAKKSRPMKKGDVILTVSGNPGLPTILAVDSCIHDGLVGFRNLKTDLILSEFFYFCLLMMKEMHGSMSVGAVFRNLNTDQIRKFKIPLPDLNSQKLIVAKIEREMELIAANKELITLFEQKIKDKIASVWGE